MIVSLLRTRAALASTTRAAWVASARSYSAPAKDKVAVIAGALNGSDPDLKDILEGNGSWAAEMRKRNPTFFDRIAKAQYPRYLYIGCCDARVDPTVLMKVDYGDLFIHRNVGNLVVGSDLNVNSAIEFAVTKLKVPHIIVCGHYDCGAVRGSGKQLDHGIIENWLRNIRDVQRLHHKELSAVEGEENKHRKLVELNVREQCLNVLKTGSVQRARMQSYKETGFAIPRIHGLVFDPAAGQLTKLEVNWTEETKEFDQIYNLYPKDQH
ncbi:carbonic anhydrase [Chytriomyces sp. MP71]|nr:carbonic anhydrase [Chytriomyces sp. MP71]